MPPKLIRGSLKIAPERLCESESRRLCRTVSAGAPCTDMPTRPWRAASQGVHSGVRGPVHTGSEVGHLLCGALRHQRRRGCADTLRLRCRLGVFHLRVAPPRSPLRAPTSSSASRLFFYVPGYPPARGRPPTPRLTLLPEVRALRNVLANMFSGRGLGFLRGDTRSLQGAHFVCGLRFIVFFLIRSTLVDSRRR